MPSKKAGSLSLQIEVQVEEVQGMNPGEVRELLWHYLDDRVQNAKEARAIIKAANARISDIRKGLHLAQPHQFREL
jgi:predicted kinase